MREGGLKLLAGYVELLELHGREIVEVVAVGTYEMREDGTRDNGVLASEATDDLVDVLLRVEA